MYLINHDSNVYKCMFALLYPQMGSLEKNIYYILFYAIKNLMNPRDNRINDFLKRDEADRCDRWIRCLYTKLFL